MATDAERPDDDTAARIVREPRVYLVGRQEVDDDALARFLDDHDVTRWSTDTVEAGEKLVEVAGRLCFDDQTEVLTDEGWRLFADLVGTERVLTMNPISREVEFQVIQAVHRHDFEGMLHHAEGRDVSFAVTPEHRQYGAWAPAGRSDALCFGFHATADIAGRRFKILSAPAGWTGSYPGSVKVDDYYYEQAISNPHVASGRSQVRSASGRVWTGPAELRALAFLLTYYAAEGSLGTKKGVVIYGDHAERVGAICRELGLPFSIAYDPRSNVPRTTVGGGHAFREFVAAACGKHSINKRLPRWVLDLPMTDLAEVWRILVATDGHRYENGREVLVTTSPVLAGQAQEILCKMGCTSASRPARTGTNHPVHIVSRKVGRPITLNDRVAIERRPYLGQVYCITTENGILYVRRHGIPHFSGNCYMSFAKPRPGGNAAYIGHILEVGHGSVLEHAVFNLIIAGVSRSFTHELVRHRAGFGYSQLSQRFVDESTCDFVEPDAIAEDPELHRVWLEAIGQSHRAYRALAEGLMKRFADVEDRTLRRKKAREAARSVLPNATETKIFVTANARALRHFIEMRGDVAADAEIRKVALAVLTLLQAESPNLFGDYTIVDLPGGGRAATTPHKKV